MYTDHAALLDSRARMESQISVRFTLEEGYSIPRSWLVRGIEDITVQKLTQLLPLLPNLSFGLTHKRQNQTPGCTGGSKKKPKMMS